MTNRTTSFLCAFPRSESNAPDNADAFDGLALDDIQWVHTFPVGAGGVAPGGRVFRFNGAELNPRLSRVDGLTWVADGCEVEFPGLALGHSFDGAAGQWHGMGLSLKGFPGSMHVAVVSNLAAAVELAKAAVQPSGSLTLLREWAPALVHAGGTTTVGLHFRARNDESEVQFRHQLLQQADIRCVLDFLRSDVPLELVDDPHKRSRLLVRSWGGSLLHAPKGRAHESTLEPPAWVMNALG